MERLKGVNERLSPANIEKYIGGCAEIGLALYTAVNQVLDDGKKPTIIIPSRGAIPVFLIAHQQLVELDGQNLLARPKTRFYPGYIFEYLSAGRISQQNLPADESVVDVILYPFTADVSSKQDNNQARDLAAQLRRSASQAVVDLISGERKSFDLNWYFFLMSKLILSFGNKVTDSKMVIESLKNIPFDKNRQLILIDTVISGRAVTDIARAFQELNHFPIFVLAVDNSSGVKLQPGLKAEIYRYSKSCHFIEFPLITEDAGAALLGVIAINFSNFNQKGSFSQINPKLFSSDSLPQSCLWAIPPLHFSQVYGRAFHGFLRYCLNPSGVSDWSQTAQEINALTSRYGPVSQRETQALIPAGKGAGARETSSHIISIELPPKQAEDWIREFARKNCR